MRRKRDVTAETAAFAHYGLSPRPRELVLARPELRVRALIEGAGEPLLLLHGLSLGAVHWAPFLARLDDAMAIANDILGHGGTDGGWRRREIPRAGREPAVRAVAVGGSIPSGSE